MVPHALKFGLKLAKKTRVCQRKIRPTPVSTSQNFLWSHTWKLAQNLVVHKKRHASWHTWCSKENMKIQLCYFTRGICNKDDLVFYYLNHEPNTCATNHDLTNNQQNYTREVQAVIFLALVTVLSTWPKRFAQHFSFDGSGNGMEKKEEEKDSFHR